MIDDDQLKEVVFDNNTAPAGLAYLYFHATAFLGFKASLHVQDHVGTVADLGHPSCGHIISINDDVVNRLQLLVSK